MPTLRVEVISLFPGMFASFLTAGVIGRAAQRGALQVNVWNPRDYAPGNYRRVDDSPYGGGPGMVMLYKPLRDCIKDMCTRCGSIPLYYLSPRGSPLDAQRAAQLSKEGHLALLCGRYDGVDERIIERFVTAEISVGDFVLSGGELAAMCVIDASARNLPGVLGNPQSTVDESFSASLPLGYPQYTRPEMIDGLRVPPILLSGSRSLIQQWRRWRSLEAGKLKRPELLGEADLEELLRLRARFDQ